MYGARKAGAAAAQQADRHADVVSEPVKLLTERQAAERACYFEFGLKDPVRAFQMWARRKGIPVKVAGRRRLYDPRVLEAFLDREKWTRKHAEKVTAFQAPVKGDAL
jgi:hypothetical protein